MPNEIQNLHKAGDVNCICAACSPATPRRRTTGPLPSRCPCGAPPGKHVLTCGYLIEPYRQEEALAAPHMGKLASQLAITPKAESLRDYTSTERKGIPVVTGVLQYFPDAIAAIARVSKAGNDKHNPGQPLHWSRGKSNDHEDSLGRHLLSPDATDPDSGETERAHRAWRDLADLQLSEERRLVALGIKPLSGIVP